MYNWMNERKFPKSRSFSAFNFSPKNLNNFVKTSFESINYNQLPIIKEEEGIISEEDNKSQPPENFLEDTLSKECPRKKTLHMGDSNDNYKNREQIKNAKTYTKLPPLININCLMNTEIKQSHHIWDTNFGKRLIHGNNDNSVKLDNKSLFGAKRATCTKTRLSQKQARLPSKFAPRSRSITEPNIKDRRGDMVGDYTQKKVSRKDPKKISKINENPPTKFCPKNKTSSNVIVNEAKSSVKITQSSSKEKVDNILSKGASKVSSSKDTLEIVPTISSFSKNRHFLTECVKNILDCTVNQFECEHCKEHFPNIEELCEHEKQHESKKETCLLCGKVFYNPNEFVQHLLTHEGVDQFSCKKCKKYFPSLKKYKQHCQDFHLLPEKVNNHQSQANFEYVRKWLTKYECKRCQMEFDSEKAQEEHKQDHIKSDLAGAYLLSPKYL